MGSVEFTLNGTEVRVDDDGRTLLEVLREDLDVRSPKDGCSPQGQCGCCTVWIDGAPRVACVTAVSRVRGKVVTTLEGLPTALVWADAFTASGASQCGFCTPGIIMRLAALPPDGRDAGAVDRALRAHLCRCTGWQTIREACVLVGESPVDMPRDLVAAGRRAALEGHAPQEVSPDVALGRGGFADDTAPPEALNAVRAADGSWGGAARAADARAIAGVVPGRRTTAPLDWPVELPEGDWVRTMRTTWTEPGYLELDATWCAPGGTAAAVLGNGGAFGGKLAGELVDTARRLADEHGTPVRIRFSREDVVRRGPKRPPLAIALRSDGSGILRVARPVDDADEQRLLRSLRRTPAAIEVEFVDVTGPPVSASLRGAGWAELAAALSSLGDAPDSVVGPDGGQAVAAVDTDGSIQVTVRCGRVLDAVVLRSYCIGAVHMALGLVRSEGIAVGSDGEPLDLTIRSFGILRAAEMPHVDVHIDDDDSEPVNGSDAVYAAVLAAAWRHAGRPELLPARN